MKKLLAVLLTVVFCLAISGLAIAIDIYNYNDGVTVDGTLTITGDGVSGSGTLTGKQGDVDGDTLSDDDFTAPPPEEL